MDNINIFFECETKITNRIKSKGLDFSDTEDLRQEVFLRFAHGLNNIKNTDNLCGYLLRITENIVNDHYRKYSKIIMEDISHIEIIENSDKEYPFADFSLMSFIEKLPEKYKEALILTELNGESQKIVAEKLNISYSGFKSRVQRAREMLKDEILNCCNYKFDSYGKIVSCCGNIG